MPRDCPVASSSAVPIGSSERNTPRPRAVEYYALILSRSNSLDLVSWTFPQRKITICNVCLWPSHYTMPALNTPWIHPLNHSSAGRPNDDLRAKERTVFMWSQKRRATGPPVYDVVIIGSGAAGGTAAW